MQASAWDGQGRLSAHEASHAVASVRLGLPFEYVTLDDAAIGPHVQHVENLPRRIVFYRGGGSCCDSNRSMCETCRAEERRAESYIVMAMCGSLGVDATGCNAFGYGHDADLAYVIDFCRKAFGDSNDAEINARTKARARSAPFVFSLPSANIDSLSLPCVENSQSPFEELNVSESRNTSRIQPARFQALAIQEPDARYRECGQEFLKSLELFVRCVGFFGDPRLGHSRGCDVPKLPALVQRGRGGPGQVGRPSTLRKAFSLDPQVDLLDRVRFGPRGNDYVGNQRAEVDSPTRTVGNPGVPRIDVGAGWATLSKSKCRLPLAKGSYTVRNARTSQSAAYFVCFVVMNSNALNVRWIWLVPYRTRPSGLYPLNQ